MILLGLGLLGLGVWDHKRKLAASAAVVAPPPVNVLAEVSPTIANDATGLPAPVLVPQTTQLMRTVPPTSVAEAPVNAERSAYFRVKTEEYFGDERRPAATSDNADKEPEMTREEREARNE